MRYWTLSKTWALTWAINWTKQTIRCTLKERTEQFPSAKETQVLWSAISHLLWTGNSWSELACKENQLWPGINPGSYRDGGRLKGDRWAVIRDGERVPCKALVQLWAARSLTGWFIHGAWRYCCFFLPAAINPFSPIQGDHTGHKSRTSWTIPANENNYCEIWMHSIWRIWHTSCAAAVSHTENISLHVQLLHCSSLPIWYLMSVGCFSLLCALCLFDTDFFHNLKRIKACHILVCNTYCIFYVVYR